MAAARRVRIEDEPAHGGDTDRESEQETPRPQKTSLKKRLSEVHHDPDGSFTNGDPSRVPLKSVNLNDDAAEKRRRRKSTKLTVIDDLAMGGAPGENAVDQENSEPRPSRQKQQINILPPLADMNISPEIMHSNFEEWMKMASDNKFNAANSWNTALIEYFADMTLLRNKEDNSINFQRASTTLDGCVKIWTSRVDSVGAETGKLLSNLANHGRDGDEDEDSDNPDADPTQAKKRRAHRPAATLAKDPTQLQTKKLDLEFHVDPLFKKTCADFDEGGAQGLLMNHLSLGVGSDALRIIFDASDSKRKMDEDEEKVEEPVNEIDISDLRRQFFPDLSVLESTEIAPSLAGFEFAGSNASFHSFDMGGDNFGGDDFNNYPAPPVEDFFSGADAVQDDFGGGMGGDDYMGSSDPVGASGEGDGPATGPYVPFDPRNAPNQRDLVMAMADADENGALDYFDKNFMKNWAGPEHWKLRRVIRKPEADTGATKTKKKEKKEAFTIDFSKPLEKDLKELSKELFAPVGKGQSINLPGTGATARKSKKKTVEKKNDHRLPDDMHFSSRQLVRLFLKPKFELRMRGRRAKINENGDGEVDADFWAQAAADQANGRRGDEDGDEDGDGNVPFNTQFFQDDYDDGPGFDGPGFDDFGDGLPQDPDEDQDLLGPSQYQKRRVRPETVNYAKKAKRVDVRKLKDNIWKGLDIIVPRKKTDKHGSEDEDEDEMDVDFDKPLTNPSEARQFSQVMSGLQKTYPKDKMDEISTSFCFICLLHLANEQGLKLESTVTEDEGLVVDDEVVDQKVGDIWGINDVDFDQPLTNPSEARQFSQVMSGLQKTYPKDKMDEISTSFCFICLLHLANEQGLKLESTVTEDEGLVVDDEVVDQKVGDIWGINVYRDPDATPAA
ncbi:Condensin complex subunit 2 [Leucoagaricus sp. SymC.cos]|nr:Condensin complex subunit 2 [Leucoagaricus sp. SymC.cos]